MKDGILAPRKRNIEEHRQELRELRNSRKFEDGVYPEGYSLNGDVQIITLDDLRCSSKCELFPEGNIDLEKRRKRLDENPYYQGLLKLCIYGNDIYDEYGNLHKSLILTEEEEYQIKNLYAASLRKVLLDYILTESYKSFEKKENFFAENDTSYDELLQEMHKEMKIEEEGIHHKYKGQNSSLSNRSTKEDEIYLKYRLNIGLAFESREEEEIYFRQLLKK